MPRKPKPDLDERFSLPEDTDPDDVLRQLMGVVESGGAESVSVESEDAEEADS